jgi:hypothetical protein
MTPWQRQESRFSYSHSKASASSVSFHVGLRVPKTLRPESVVANRQRRLHRVLSFGSSPTCGEAGAWSLWEAECVWLSSQNANGFGAKRKGPFCAKFFTIVGQKNRRASASGPITNDGFAIESGCGRHYATTE